MISIIIRTYNEEEYIERLLISINKQKINTNYELIIVDSESTDNTVKICKKYNTKIITIKKEDFTFGKSLNLGIKNSKGDVCVFISGHCIPYNEYWLDELVKPLKIKNVGLCYGKQIGNNRTKISEHVIFKKWFPNNNLGIQNNSFCNNANCSIKKEIWNKTKYDEHVTGLEDIVFGNEIMKRGWKLYYNYNSIVYHIHNETYKKIRNRYKRESITYSSLYKYEKFNFFHFIKYTIRNIVIDLKFIEKYKLKYIISIILFRINQFYGTYMGYKYTKNNNYLRKKFYY